MGLDAPEVPELKEQATSSHARMRRLSALLSGLTVVLLTGGVAVGTAALHRVDGGGDAVQPTPAQLAADP
eukprot:gene4092-1247_t